VANCEWGVVSEFVTCSSRSRAEQLNMGLERFIEAQARYYETALREIGNGKKRSHWMWYIFPQVRGLGTTETSRYYAIQDIGEATQYLAHEVLGTWLTDIGNALLELPGKNPTTFLVVRMILNSSHR